MQETRFRYIHHDRAMTRVKLLSKFDHGSGSDWAVMTIGAADTKAVVMETLIDRKVARLTLLHIYSISYAQSFFKEYPLAKDLDISCPVPVNFLFRYLSLLPNLRSLRLRKQVFSKIVGAEKESRSWAICCPNVDTFRVSYDVEHYNSLPATGKYSLDRRIATALRMGHSTFTGLKKLQVKVPANIENDLDSFIEDYALIARDGEKFTAPDDGSIIFSNMGERNDSDLEDEKKDDIEYKTKTKEEYICQLRKCSDDIELKKPQIRFQNESEDEAGVRSDSEISVVKTRPLSGIFKFFKSNKGVHHGSIEGAGSYIKAYSKTNVHRSRSCPPRKEEPVTLK